MSMGLCRLVPVMLVSPSEGTNPGSGPRVLPARQAQENMKFAQANSRFMPINTDYNFVT